MKMKIIIEKARSNHVLRFLFPLPSLIICLVFFFFLLFAKTDAGERIGFLEFIIIYLLFFIIFIFPIDAIIFIYKKIKNTDMFKKSMNKHNKKSNINTIPLHKSEKTKNPVTIDYMKRFVNIPFEWHWVMDLFCTNETYWFMLNTNNQYIALSYIDKLNQIIDEEKEFIKSLREYDLCTEEIDFCYPVPMYRDSFANTYVECCPFTQTGKRSKYPVVLHFSSSKTETSENGYQFQIHPFIGEIKIMEDGNIGSAKIQFLNYYKITFGLYGINLIIKRIDGVSGNIYNYKNEIGY